MKKLIVLMAILLSGVVFAQDSKNPTYEVQGDLIAATLYHDNGVVAQTGFYTEDGKLHGEWISYDANGNKTAIAYYEEGKKVGVWTFFMGDEIKVVEYTDLGMSQVETWKKTDTRVVSF